MRICNTSHLHLNQAILQSRNRLPTTEGAEFAETGVCIVLKDEEQGVGSSLDCVRVALLQEVMHCETLSDHTLPGCDSIVQRSS